MTTDLYYIFSSKNHEVSRLRYVGGSRLPGCPHRGSQRRTRGLPQCRGRPVLLWRTLWRRPPSSPSSRRIRRRLWRLWPRGRLWMGKINKDRGSSMTSRLFLLEKRVTIFIFFPFWNINNFSIKLSLYFI